MKSSSRSSNNFVALLRDCIKHKSLEKGRALHLEIYRNGLLQGKNPAVCSMLVDLYVKCGSVLQAHEFFNMLSNENKDVVTWTALIAGYVQSDNGGHTAWSCFKRMQLEAVCPNAFTFSCILKACGRTGGGEEVHCTIYSSGLLQKNLVVASALVDLYAKRGNFVEAEKALIGLPTRDVFVWTALILGYVDYEHGTAALKCFEQMQRDRVFPSVVTYACVLKACGIAGQRDKGRDIHIEIAKRDLLRGDLVLCSSLIDMYAKCGLLAEAKGVFDRSEVRDVVLWTALIGGYADNDFGEEAYVCFSKMQKEGISPNACTFLCCLKACGNIGAAAKGEEVHADIKRSGYWNGNLVIGTALVDMYAKCGLLDKAHKVFDKISVRDKVLWNSLLTGYSQHGDIENVLCIFERMRRDGYDPVPCTFVSVISACTYGGFVEIGIMCFNIMRKGFDITPELEHHTCMVDLYSRAGRLDEAAVMLNVLPCHPNMFMLLTVLGACRKLNNLQLGLHAFQLALGLDKQQSSAYTGMYNLYVQDLQEGKDHFC